MSRLFKAARGAILPWLSERSAPRPVRKSNAYDYAMVQSQLLIVDPATKKIVSIITE